MRDRFAWCLAMSTALGCSAPRDRDTRYDGGSVDVGADVSTDIPTDTAMPQDRVTPPQDAGGMSCTRGGAPCPIGQRCVTDQCRPSGNSCPGMEPGCEAVFITGGTFTLGESGTNGATPLQSNLRVNDFELDAFEVTVARFRRWWTAGHPMMPPPQYPSGTAPMPTATPAEPTTTQAMAHCNWSDLAAGRESMPINCVDWNTAMAFCVWDGGRLPTEAEWEYAARFRMVPEAMPGRRFPWGDAEPALSGACDYAQWRGCMGEAGGITRNVGSFMRGMAGGVHDLAGNVGEWTADTAAPYDNAQCWGGGPRMNPLCTTGSNRIVRGMPQYMMGGSAMSSDVLRSAARNPMGAAATERRTEMGFRCARSR